MRSPALILAAALALSAAQPVLAEGDAKVENADQSVKISPVALPVVVDGHLANYVFVTVKVLLNPGANALALSDKEPYFRDALVRMAHRTPFTVAGDYNRIDEGRLTAALMREASAIVGAAAIRSVVVSSQAPQHRIPTPRS